MSECPNCKRYREELENLAREVLNLVGPDTGWGTWEYMESEDIYGIARALEKHANEALCEAEDYSTPSTQEEV